MNCPRVPVSDTSTGVPCSAWVTKVRVRVGINFIAWLIPAFLTPGLTQAHCYSIWHYNHPQRCNNSIHNIQPKEDRSWYVEFILPEPDERTQAIEKLKKELNK